MKKYLLAAAAIILAAAVAVLAQDVSSFTDKRDWQVYKTVKIGSQVWMAQNLNYAAKESVCYKNKAANCNKYGRLYNWETAKTACPAGWHLPSDAEWTTLTDFVGGDSTAGTKLKSKNGWNNNGNGTDDFGFSALPGGSGSISDGGFSPTGYHGIWWSATRYDTISACHSRINFANLNNITTAICACYREMYYNEENVDRHYRIMTNLHSVRCVRD